MQSIARIDTGVLNLQIILVGRAVKHARSWLLAKNGPLSHKTVSELDASRAHLDPHSHGGERCHCCAPSGSR